MKILKMPKKNISTSFCLHALLCFRLRHATNSDMKVSKGVDVCECCYCLARTAALAPELSGISAPSQQELSNENGKNNWAKAFRSLQIERKAEKNCFVKTFPPIKKMKFMQGWGWKANVVVVARCQWIPRRLLICEGKYLRETFRPHNEKFPSMWRAWDLMWEASGRVVHVHDGKSFLSRL